jgi:long-chain acyl-CoA synthetase
MNQFNTINLASAESLPKLFYDTALANLDYNVWSYAVFDFIGSEPRSWKSSTYREVLNAVSALVNFLQHERIGLAEDLMVAICANTRPEWIIADLAIMACKGITVAIYTSLPKEDINFIAQDSNSKIFFAENQEVVDKILSFENQIHKIITFEEVNPHEKVISYSRIIKNHNFSNIPEECKYIKRLDLATLVYTSGSTGIPKGVKQTHGNHLANLEQVSEAKVFGPKGNLFLYLPLAHSFARLVGYLGLFTDTKLKFPAITDCKTSKLDLSSIAEDLKNSHSEFIPSIPRLFEKVKNSLELKANGTTFNSKVLHLTISAALKKYSAEKEGKSAGTLTKLVFNRSERIRKKIKSGIFGDNFKYAISGGAKLNIEVTEFFAAIGITILQGYGLTETCVATNVNRFNNNKIGSVGQTFRGIEIKIAEDQEILFKGPNVCSGYYNRPEETAKSWDSDGWFYTGDLGYLDNEGFLFITGRKKEIIVTASGKKITPIKVEHLLEKSFLIEQAVVFGTDKPYCVALILPANHQSLKHESHNVKDHPEIWNTILETNKNLASYEQIKNAYLIFEPFTVENSLLTPTMKLRRQQIYQTYYNEIEKLYSN